MSDRIVNPTVAEYWGGPRDGSVQAFPGIVPSYVKEAVCPPISALMVETEEISPYIEYEERIYERRVFVGLGGYEKFMLVYPEYDR